MWEEKVCKKCKHQKIDAYFLFWRSTLTFPHPWGLHGRPTFFWLQVDAAFFTRGAMEAKFLLRTMTCGIFKVMCLVMQEIVVKKLLGGKNPTDIGTKHMIAEKIARYLPWLSQERRSGIDSNTLQIQTLVGWSNLRFVLFWPVIGSNKLHIAIKHHENT